MEYVGSMHTIESVIATNKLIRLPNGESVVFANEALVDGAEQLNSKGGMPHLFNHDWTRPVGWMHRAWVEKNGNEVRLCAETQVPETPQEHEALFAVFAEYCMKERAERTEPYRQALSGFPDDSVDLCHDFSCVYLSGTNVVERLMPEIHNSIDGDGLLPLESNDVFQGGWVACGPYLLAPSRFMRLSWSLPNPPNRYFLTALADVKRRNPRLATRIAIDPCLIGIPSSFIDFQQREYWWGPPFSGDPIKQAYGVTVHGPTKYDALSGLKHTEFWCYGREERVFQIEEVLEHPVWLANGSDIRAPARFLHSIFNQETGLPYHLDGAVRLYSEDEWHDRLLQPIDKFGKRAIRHKLWSVDGEMQLDDWYKLIHMFFKGNFTIAEFFGLDGPTQK